MNMNDKIHIVAIGMGYEVQPLTNQVDDLMVIMRGRSTIPFSYNPLTNHTQDSELELKLEIGTAPIREGLWQATAWIDLSGMTGGIEGRGATPAEARLMAAYEYFKDEE